MNSTRGTPLVGRRGPARSGGFTLVELLTVIIIISVLIAITFAVGQGVIQGQRARLAQDTIRVADVAVDAYYRDVGDTPPVLVEAPGANAGDPTVLLPMADAADGQSISGADESRKTAINSVGLFVRSLDRVGLDEVLRPLSTEQLSFFDPDDAAPGGELGFNRQPELRTILDPWGRPMRFVHPRFDGLIMNDVQTLPGTDVNVGPAGVQLVTESDLPSGFDVSVFGGNRFPMREIRRNHLPDEVREDDASLAGLTGDSDGGICPSGRPYLYSAGPDGDPSTLEDNVYTTQPTYSAD